MLELMEESNAKAVCIRASGQLTSKDYESGFMPKLDHALGKGKKINMLFYLDKEFKGWDLDGAWQDTKFGVAHRNHFNKFALVGGPKYTQWGMKLSTVFMDCTLKIFTDEELQEAIAWVNEA